MGLSKKSQFIGAEAGARELIHLAMTVSMFSPHTPSHPLGKVCFAQPQNSYKLLNSGVAFENS